MAFIDSKIIARTDWSEGLWTIRLDAELGSFLPGQFVNLALEIDGELVKRAYSLASAPGQPPEFFLVRVDGGVLTPRLEPLGVGDTLKVSDDPQGFFTLEQVPAARDLWLVSTGTGLAPYVSMLRNGEPWRRFRNVVLVNGARCLGCLGYREELGRLATEREAFRYVPLVTRQDVRGILRGRVPDLLRDGRLEQAAGLDLAEQHAHVMLCGHPGMIRDTVAALGERGLRKHRRRAPGHITFEKYW